MARDTKDKKGGKKGGGKGITEEPPRLNRDDKRAAKKSGLSNDQYASIRQREKMDLRFGDYGQNLMPQIEQSYGQPFDWNSLPQREQMPDWENLPGAPVSGDYDAWRKEQIQGSMDEFDAQMQPQFERDKAQFDQQMYNRGIPVGSELYNRQSDQLMKSQSEARNSYLQDARSGAANSASQFFNIGQQARGSALGEGITRYNLGNQNRDINLNEQMAQRNLPFNEYNQLMAARSPFDMQNLGYQQQRQLQQDQFGQQKWMLKNTPQGGGGGGGGGPAPPGWIQQGFANYQDQAAFEDSRKLNLYNQMNPRGPSGPSYGAQLGGGILGAGLGILGGYLAS